MSDLDTERDFVQRFVRPEMRERWLAQLPGNGRKRLLRRLHHNFDFEAPFAERLPVRQGLRDGLATVLRTKNVPERLYFMSTVPDIDGRWWNIVEVDGFGMLESYAAYSPERRLAVIRDEYHYYLISYTDVPRAEARPRGARRSP